jgi:site-specific DNA-methyltransferase (adenine-specific)
LPKKVFITEECKLFHGDCLKVLDVVDSGSVDMIYADIPYGSVRCSWDHVIPFDPMWQMCHRLIRDNGAMLLHAAGAFSHVLCASNINGYAYEWYWDKCFAANFVQSKRQPLKVMEQVLVFSKDGKMPCYFPQMTKREKPIYKGGNKQSEAIPIARTLHAQEFGKKKKRYDLKYPTTYLRFNVRTDRGLHPTQKPVALAEYFIKTYTNPGETVLDFTMGVATTGVAALKLGRKFIGVELEEKYYDLAVARMMKTMKKEQE